MLERLRIPAVLAIRAAGTARRHDRTDLPVSNDSNGVDFVVVTQLSEGGAQLITPVPMQMGQQVQLKLPMLEPLVARIVWVSSRLAGCEFLDPLHPAIVRVLIAVATTDQAAWRQSMAGTPFPTN